MKLYLTRHGQTDWNIERRAQGRTDVPLNAVGREQAKDLAEKLSGLDFDAVYASPLKRAAETARIATGGSSEIIYDDRLLERSFGQYEGKVVASWLELVDGVDIDDMNLETIPGEVEPVKSVLKRARGFLDDLKKKYPDDAIVLVVGHGAVSKAFDWILSEHKDGETFGTSHLGNAEVRKYTF